MRRTSAIVLMASALFAYSSCNCSASDADYGEFLSIYKEMVETDTSIQSGDCTKLSHKIASRLKEAGFPDESITLYSVADHPKEGGIVAVLPGRTAASKALLLIGHIDVVNADSETWSRDPYKFTEENGYYYGRGTQDMKGLDAIWIDALIKLRRSGKIYNRTLKLALTCGEETSWAFNGAAWLTTHRADLVAADFALNEGGGGRANEQGKMVIGNMHLAEKSSVNFRVEATDLGGHSSTPTKENAIYTVASALIKLRDFEFPMEMNSIVRNYFAIVGAARKDKLGDAMHALSEDPSNEAAEKIVNTDKVYHAMLRNTCVATLVKGGEANNAIPSRASANINCRLLPGATIESVQSKLSDLIDAKELKIEFVDTRGPISTSSPLDDRVLRPAQILFHKYYPDVPFAPSMSTGATDGIFFKAVGIPVYGPPGLYTDPDGNGVHGSNERASVAAIKTSRKYLYDLILSYID